MQTRAAIANRFESKSLRVSDSVQLPMLADLHGLVFPAPTQDGSFEWRRPTFVAVGAAGKMHMVVRLSREHLT
eukprot:1093121-Amphidinium_carterae.2